MAEWLSYSLSDFLLFSPEVYWRLVQRHVANWGVLALVFELALLVVFVDAIRRKLTTGIALILAVSWWVLGWYFYLAEYQSINTFADYLGYMCLLQALLYCCVGTWQVRLRLALPKYFVFACGLSVAMVLSMPIVAYFTTWQWQIGVVGITPIATCLISLCCLGNQRMPWLLLLVPLIILLVESLTLYTLMG